MAKKIYDRKLGRYMLHSHDNDADIGGPFLVTTNNLSDVDDASTSRTNLGLGSIATQDADDVSITGGSISGISLSGLVSPLAVTDGGTGATNAADARTNLDVYSKNECDITFLKLDASNDPVTGQLDIQVATADEKALTLQTTDDNTTNYLLDFLDSSDNSLVNFSADGQMYVSNISAIGTAIQTNAMLTLGGTIVGAAGTAEITTGDKYAGSGLTAPSLTAISADDDSTVNFTTSTPNTVTLGTFGFNIPDGATINKIVFKIEGGSAINYTGFDPRVVITLQSVSGGNSNSYTLYLDTNGVGGVRVQEEVDNGLWGKAWTAGEFDDGNFTLQTVFYAPQGYGGSPGTRVDYIFLEVFYEGGSQAFVEYAGGEIDVSSDDVGGGYGLYVDTLTTTGANNLLVAYGLFIKEQTAGLSNYAIYAEGDNYLGGDLHVGNNLYIEGDVGVGINDPAYNVHVYGASGVTRITIENDGTADSDQVSLDMIAGANNWIPYVTGDVDAWRLYGATLGQDILTVNSNGLTIDNNSNTRCLRLVGAAAANEIVDLFMGIDGQFIVDLRNGNDTSQYFEIRTEDDQFGVIIRESDGTDVVVAANLYMTDAADDYFSITVNSVADTDALNITASDKVGVGMLPSNKLDVAGVVGADNFISDVAIGTQPYATTSTTLNTNLNADLLDGNHAAAFALSGHTHALDDLSDVAITSVADNEVLAYDSGGNWINQTAAEAGLAAASHVHAASDITSGTLAHEIGGLELDISGITTGDVLAGASAGVIEIVEASGASDGDVLTIQADGTADWEALPASGANTALSNLASVAINTSLISDADSTDDLGSSSNFWKDLYVDRAGIGANPDAAAVLVVNSVSDLNPVYSAVEIYAARTDTAGGIPTTLTSEININPASSSTCNFTAFYGRAIVDSACAQDVSEIRGLNFTALHSGTGLLTNMLGIRVAANINSTGSITEMRVFDGTIVAGTASVTSSVSNGYGMYIRKARAKNIDTFYYLYNPQWENSSYPTSNSYFLYSLEGQNYLRSDSTAAAVPVLELEQLDVSEEFIRFTGTAASGVLTQSIVDEGDQASETREGWLKVYVVDDGNQISDQAYYVPIYTLSA